MEPRWPPYGAIQTSINGPSSHCEHDSEGQADLKSWGWVLAVQHLLAVINQTLIPTAPMVSCIITSSTIADYAERRCAEARDPSRYHS